jgi:hypothetical protein
VRGTGTDPSDPQPVVRGPALRVVLLVPLLVLYGGLIVSSSPVDPAYRDAAAARACGEYYGMLQGYGGRPIALSDLFDGSEQIDRLASQSDDWLVRHNAHGLAWASLRRNTREVGLWSTDLFQACLRYR